VKREQALALLAQVPVDPADLAVPAIGVVVAALGAAELVAATSIGTELERAWRGATLLRDEPRDRAVAARAFALAPSGGAPLPLVVRGTNFQLKVWEALLRIPFGRLVSYQAVARATGQPSAARAVGRAVGANARAPA
jgi:AraC family transcriptional regulator of adaptative response/methylated-DNA-[protein]-cysteine methyltransferase